ncbi:MAG TPA: trimethylamine methyltransferase family protein, partial [Anaerolineales bacterium]|nr:trimethylamine methyltransferase family protein [Anaerolineales bacterium]
MQVQSQVLSQSEREAIHEQSLRILEEIGVQIRSRKARAILKQHGASGDSDSGVIRLPRELVAQALTTAPGSFTLGARVPEHDVPLPSACTGYVLDNGGIYIRDFKTGERRATTLQDNLDILRVFDRMQSASVVWTTTIHEFDPRSASVKATIASFMHTGLHIQDELERPAQVPFI